MYHVSAQGVDERIINVHYYYYYCDDDKAAARICYALLCSSVSRPRLQFRWPPFQCRRAGAMPGRNCLFSFNLLHVSLAKASVLLTISVSLRKLSGSVC